MYKNNIDEYQHLLIHFITKGRREGHNVLFLEDYENTGENPIVAIFLNHVADKIKKIDNSIRVMSNEINLISILEFTNQDTFKLKLQEWEIDQDEIEQIKEAKKKPSGNIIISKVRLPNYKPLKIDSGFLINSLVKLLDVKNKECLVKSIKAMDHRVQKSMYLSAAKQYFRIKLTEDNYKKELIDYDENEMYNLVVSSDLYESLKTKNLINRFVFGDELL